MTAKRALGLLVALVALLIAPATVFAQDNAKDAAPPAAAASDAAAPASGDQNAAPQLPWLKFCSDLKDGRKLCVTRQLVYAQNQLIARFIVRNNPADANPLLVLASMPNGVTLPFGLRLQIDNGRELVLPYLQCDPQMCNVRTVVDEAFINSLKRGAVLKLKAKNPRGVEITVEIDLKGFTAVYDGDKYVALDQNAETGNQTATDALGQAVQDLAEQIRRQKSTDGTAPADQAAQPDKPAANGQ